MARIMHICSMNHDLNVSAGFILHFVIQIFLLLWLPHPDQIYFLYLVSGIWGLAEATWETLIAGTSLSIYFNQFISKKNYFKKLSLQYLKNRGR